MSGTGTPVRSPRLEPQTESQSQTRGPSGPSSIGDEDDRRRMSRLSTPRDYGKHTQLQFLRIVLIKIQAL